MAHGGVRRARVERGEAGLACWATMGSDAQQGKIGHIAWESRGDGPGLPVLALHGVTDAGACWWPALESLTAARRVVTVDARGHGRTDLTDEPFTLAALAADAAVVARAVLGRPAVVLGHSMGGLAAEELTLTEPDLVAALVLEDPAWIASSDPRNDRGAPAWLPDVIADAAGRTHAEIVAAGRLENPRWSAEELDAWATARLQLDPALGTGVHRWADRDWVEAMADVRPPVTLITGDPALGALVTAEQAARVADLLGDRLTHAAVPGVGHCIRREDLAGFLAVVGAALAAADAAADAA